MTAESKPEPLWKVDEIAAFLSTSRGGIYKLVERKQIPYIRFGRKLLFHPSKIRRWVDGHSVDAA